MVGLVIVCDTAELRHFNQHCNFQQLLETAAAELTGLHLHLRLGSGDIPMEESI